MALASAIPLPSPDATPPKWAEELSEHHRGGEARLVVLHGNVGDLTLYDGGFLPTRDYLCQVLLPSMRQVVVRYDVSGGLDVIKSDGRISALDAVRHERDPSRVLPALEKLLDQHREVGVVIDFAEMIAPDGDVAHLSGIDRQCVTAFLRWSLATHAQTLDNLVLLVTERLSDLNARIVSSTKTALVKVPLPDSTERRRIIAALYPGVEPPLLSHLTDVTAALRGVQIQAAALPSAQERERERTSLALKALLHETEKRFPLEKPLELISLLPRHSSPAQRAADIIQRRKREIIERDCLGLIRLVDARHDFSAVGGMEEIKRDLIAVAQHIKAGERDRVPMGLLFTGPMGTGKTFAAEAFIKETGLTGIQLKNFRSKWIGATEANLERILGVVQAMGQVVILIDEADRAFGDQDGENDGGTGARVIARLKEFMGNTENRGRVLFILLTNRPDRLDADLKRAGRLDRKIPFLHPQDPPEIEAVMSSLIRRHGFESKLEFPRDQPLLQSLLGYSQAELEGVVLLAAELAGAITRESMDAALFDYLPSRDRDLVEYQELIAIFETSNRKYLPKKYERSSATELQQRLQRLRAAFVHRR